MQSSSQIVTTNKPTPSFFTGRMPFLSPNQQCQSTEGKSAVINNDLLLSLFAENFTTVQQQQQCTHSIESCHS